jgi:cobalt-zinc-cadmium efflux system membrane fusion protein
MRSRLWLAIVAFLAGVAIAGMFLGTAPTWRRVVGLAGPHAAVLPGRTPEAGAAAGHEEAASEKRARVRLSEGQITEAQIEVAPVGSATLSRRITVPGTIIPDADRIARVSVKLSGTVAELRKRLGDAVAKDEVIAILESREVADAKSEYLAARLTNDLQQDLFDRDKALWEKRISTEQQFLRSRNLAAQSRMRLDIARQKLFALGLVENEISALPSEPEQLLRRQEVRSPIAGRVVERKVDAGTVVGRDNLETELFVVVNLDWVWVELAVSPTDLPAIKEAQPVAISARGVDRTTDGEIVFISPLIDRESRAARVVAEIANAEGGWHPGSFVTAAITVGAQPVALAVPTSAVQIIGDDKVVFVRTPEGFEKRVVEVGRHDDRSWEVASGLEAGEAVAVANSFVLKAELLKGAGDED